MCGICGFIVPSSDPVAQQSPAIIQSMMKELRRRGPDGEGFEEFKTRDGNWTVVLGQTRLSILDLPGGKQPLANEDQTVWTSFNGEIFNFQELRKDLEAKGHRFRTHSDTEVLVHLYEEKGPEGVRQLNGMFAYSVWDQNREELFLARDPAGIKPLYYAPFRSAHGATGLAFASELTSLLAHPFVERKLDPDALRSFFFFDSVPAPQSILKGVQKLPAASWMIWKKGVLEEPRRFWSYRQQVIEAQRKGSSLDSDQGAEEALRAQMTSAVRRQLVADVPVGCFLSGGIDSTLVAALAQEELSLPLQTFSIGFENAAFDESPFAQMVAKQFGTQHRVQMLGEKDLLAHLDEALNCLDEPMADPSVIPTYMLSKFAAGHVKVVVGGDGGDELFGGYPTYFAQRLKSLIDYMPSALKAGLVDPVVRSLPTSHSYQSFEWKLKRFLLRWDQDPLRCHFRWMSATDLPDLDQLLPETRGRTPWVLENNQWTQEIDPVSQLMQLDFENYMAGSVLTKVDRASMACGLEVRPPFLDRDVVQFAAELPLRFKVRGSKKKLVLRHLAGRLAGPIIEKRPKRGFAIPLAAWFQGNLQERTNLALNDSGFLKDYGLNGDVLRIWNRQHLNNQVDRSKPLWGLLVLHHWHHRTH